MSILIGLPTDVDKKIKILKERFNVCDEVLYQIINHCDCLVESPSFMLTYIINYHYVNTNTNVLAMNINGWKLMPENRLFIIYNIFEDKIRGICVDYENLYPKDISNCVVARIRDKKISEIISE